MKLAPIALFAYNRPTHLLRSIAALATNEEASRCDLTIFCDGPRDGQTEAVAATRAVAQSASGFASINVVERPVNLGLAASVSSGVTAILERHESVLVFEDDILASPHCLNYVNRALEHYQDDRRVASIGCYVFPVEPPLRRTFFLRVTDCFGWATWRDRWASYSPDAARLADEIDRRGLGRSFDLEGRYPYMRMLRDCAASRNSSWAVRWYASQFLQGRVCLYPGPTMTVNIGMDGSGVHSGTTDAYNNVLAAEPAGEFPDEVREDAVALEETAEFLATLLSENARLGVRIRNRVRGFYRKVFANA